MKVDSREYKLLVHHEPFVDPGAAVAEVWGEIENAVGTLPGVRTKGKLDEEESREIFFLDTPNFTLRRFGLILRQRSLGKGVEWTLKSRSEDRYFAAGTDVRPAAGFEDNRKLEEDIAPPFRCRFSHSATVALDAKQAQVAGRTLGDAAMLFPALKLLQVDGRLCDPKTELRTVNDIVVDESTWKGGKIAFDEILVNEKQQKGSIALTAWRRGKGRRPAIAELSFRIKFDEKLFHRELAIAARTVYKLLLRMDCARIGGLTKTEYIYRDNVMD